MNQNTYVYPSGPALKASAGSVPISASTFGAERKTRSLGRPYDSAGERKRFYEARERLNRERQLRTRKFVQVTAFLILLCVMVSALLYKQSRLMTQNYANASVRNELELLTVDNQQKESEIVSYGNQKEIAEAALRMGFKTPSAAQIVRIAVPQENKVLAARVSGSHSDTRDYERVLSDLETYFRDVQP